MSTAASLFAESFRREAAPEAGCGSHAASQPRERKSCEGLDSPALASYLKQALTQLGHSSDGRSNRSFAGRLGALLRDENLKPLLIAAGITSVAGLLGLKWASSGFDLQIPSNLTGLLALPLGLLLVFRTTSAQKHFDEGRARWGTIVTNVRGLMGDAISMFKSERSVEKAGALLDAFVWSSAFHLQDKKDLPLLKRILVAGGIDAASFPTRLESTGNVPATLLDELKLAIPREELPEFSRLEMNKKIDQLGDALGACERIHTTPLPLSYRRFLTSVLGVYSSLLSFTFCQEVGASGIPAAFLLSGFLFSLRSLAAQVENPFGSDRDDIGTGRLCQKIHMGIVEAIGRRREDSAS